MDINIKSKLNIFVLCIKDTPNTRIISHVYLYGLKCLDFYALISRVFDVTKIFFCLKNLKSGLTSRFPGA